MATTLLLGSALLYIIASNLAWRYVAVPHSRVAERLRQLAATNWAQALYESLRLLYYLGLPFAALVLGWVDVRALGLGFLDWANGIRWAIVLTLATWSLLMFVWVPYLRATMALPLAGPAALTWARRIVEVIYMQAHWAFYRAACILLLAQWFKDDEAIYWGTSVGLLLTFVEAWLDPRVRRHLAQVGEGEFALWSAGQAIINAVGFVLTRNVWLSALIHLALEFSVPHLRPAPAPTPAPTLRVNVVDTR